MSKTRTARDRLSNDFKDPVCGMEVSRNTAAAVAEYKGETYYFCAPVCRDRFLEDPEKYANPSEG